MATPKSKDPQSARSRKRANRGFTSLDESSRKHRRANRRLLEGCYIPNLNGVMETLKPGEKGKARESEHYMTASGAIKYH